jgi:uncharacterized membrane protein (UPF0127 family)
MSDKQFCRVINHENKRIIASNIEVAGSFFPRMRGLLGRKTLSAGEGMLLWPCNAIHCFGMRFPIDAIFLEHQYRVTHIKENLTPYSLASDRQASGVLELKAGESRKHGLKVGDQLIICFAAGAVPDKEARDKEKCGRR